MGAEAFKVLRSESANKKIVDEELKHVVSAILPNMLQQPVYRELSIELKGKVAE